MARTRYVGENETANCIRCKKDKPIDEFPKSYFRGGKQYRRSYCKACWNDHNRDEYHNGGKTAYLQRIFGITLEQFNELLEKQDGKCAICGMPEGINTYSFAVDHDHKTNKVRGLLCARCNTGLGIVENKEFLIKALAYLEEHLVPEREGG